MSGWHNSESDKDHVLQTKHLWAPGLDSGMGGTGCDTLFLIF